MSPPHELLDLPGCLVLPSLGEGSPGPQTINWSNSTENIRILKKESLLYPGGWSGLLLVVVPVPVLVLVFFVVSVIVLDTTGGLLGSLQPFMFTVEPVFILYQGRCLRHLLPVAILKYFQCFTLPGYEVYMDII